MIIQCDDCQTRFRIGDDKVTARGVRVRCTRCGHTFVVRRSEPEAAAASGSAAAPDAAPAPDSGTAPGAEAPAPAETGARPDAGGWDAGLSGADGLAPDAATAGDGAAGPGGNLADSLFGDLDLEDGPPAAFAGSTDDELDAALSGLGSAGRQGRAAPASDPFEAEDFAGGAHADAFDAADADPFSADADPFSAAPGAGGDDLMLDFGADDAGEVPAFPGEPGEARDERDAAFLRESDGLLDAAGAGGPGDGDALSFDWGGDLGGGLGEDGAAPASPRDDGSLGALDAPPLTDDYAPPGADGLEDDDPFAGLDLTGDGPDAEPPRPPREAPGERDAPTAAAGSATSARTPLSGAAPPVGTAGTQPAAPVEAEPRRTWGVLLANGLFAAALVVVALGAWVAHRTGGRIDATLLSPRRVAEAFGEPGGPAWQVSEVSSGLYATRSGAPVLVVRGRLERRSAADWPRVRVRVVDGAGREVAAADAVAGGRLSPEAVWSADPDDLAPLLDAAGAERPAEPGDGAAFVAVLPAPAGGLEGTRIRAEVRPSEAAR